jgi:hypothetical protein
MTGLGRRQALIGLCTTLAGCVPEQKAITQSNAASVSGRKLKRVLIAIHVQSLRLTESQNASLLQADELKRAFNAKWPSLEIAVEVVDTHGAPDNGGSLLQDANIRFRATQVLLLRTSQIKSSGPYIKGYEIEARLFEGTPSKLVWRAATELPDYWQGSGTPSGRLEAADRYVDSLTAKLREDGLI